MTNSYLSQEWQALHSSHEQHEKNALHIKLSCVALVTIGSGLLIAIPLLAVCVMSLWIIEAIFKTYQGRIADRLLQVETLLALPKPEEGAMQLYTAWVSGRSGLVGLLASYARSACKPTVAFPYLPLLLIGAYVRS